MPASILAAEQPESDDQGYREGYQYGLFSHDSGSPVRCESISNLRLHFVQVALAFNGV